MSTIRDRLWIWGHAANSHTKPYKGKVGWGLSGASRITPTEAAHYMGIPNCVMVVYGNKPEPPFYQEALAMNSLEKVVWSIVGDASTTRTDKGASDLDEVLGLAKRFPNIRGGIMDDFFHTNRARHTPEALSEFHRRLNESTRPMDLWVVLYNRQLDQDFSEHLQYCDVVTFWTMVGSELSDLEGNFERFVAVTRGKRRVLGCYMWNYGEEIPMTIEQMEQQCSLGLRWLKEGRIEGMIFLASCICDLDLEAVEWTREWISRVGGQSVS